jgi:lysophospholipase L1-like esterase
MFFVLSPYFVDNPSRAYEASREVARENGVEVIDCYNEPAMMKQELFRDLMHLNDEGAHVWSSYLAHLLKNKI